MNKNLVRYNVTKNLQTSIVNRLTVAERVAKAHSVKVAREYQLFRDSLNVTVPKGWDVV